jgi:hypothetical protein
MRIHRKCFLCRKSIPDDATDYIELSARIMSRPGRWWKLQTIYLHTDCYIPSFFSSEDKDKPK